MVRILMASSVLVLAMAQVGWAQNWPGFRGPGSLGVSAQKGLPDTWSAEKNIAWKVKVPGRAWSSPIIWGDRVFITNAVTEASQEKPKKGLYFGGNRPKPHDAVYQWQIQCFNLVDGKLVWKKVARESKPKSAIHLKSSYASETPVTDGKHVYAFFGSPGLFCYDMDGKLIWSKDLGVFKTRFGWGTASSPILHEDKLILQCDNEEQSYVVAYDKTTGKEIWRANRKGGTSWATPYIWKNKLRTELITCATEAVRSYDPSTGKLLWGMGPMSSIVITTPFSDDQRLYINSGYVGDRTRPIHAIKPGGSGNISLKSGETSSEHVAWSQRQIGSYNPSPILVGNRLYVLYDRGVLACFDAATGQRLYRERLKGGWGQFTCSPWSYDGKIFLANEDGQTWVIPAGDAFKISHMNTIDEMFMATPAIGKNSLILRGMDHLYCIRNN